MNQVNVLQHVCDEGGSSIALEHGQFHYSTLTSFALVPLKIASHISEGAYVKGG